MATTSDMPHVEDVYSVGSRVSWSAILAGAAVALAIQFLLGILTATIWAAVNDNGGNSSIANARPYFAILVACVAFLVGGFVTSRLTAGENQTEALLYGVVTWAAVVAIMAHGVSAGHEMLEDIRHPVASSNLDWETPARNAGLTQEQIAEIRAKVPANNRTENVAAGSPEARRALWFTFAGIWLSMAAAALGAYVGAGPTFRLAVRTRATVAGIQ